MCLRTKYVAFENTILKSCECGYKFPQKIVLDLATIRSQTLLKALWELGKNKYEEQSGVKRRERQDVGL